MLEIIGWLLCVYLDVKGFELLAMREIAAFDGAAIAFLAAPLFFHLINVQSDASQAPINQFSAR